MSSRMPPRTHMERMERLVRIDHSDVYFHNERLDEDLTYDLDSILRKRCRQRIARDCEISELKKLIRPRTTGHAVTNSRLTGRDRAEQVVRDSTKSARLKPVKDSQGWPRLNEGEKNKCSGLSEDHRVRKDDAITVHGLTARPRQEISRPPVAATASASSRNVSLRHAENGSIDQSSQSSDEDDDSDYSDDSSDDDSDTDSASSEELCSKGCQGKKLITSPSAKCKPSDTLRQIKDRHKTVRWQEENRDGAEYRIDQLKERTRGGKAELKMNLAILKLDTVPIHWFTTVLQPKDSRPTRQPATSQLSSRRQNSTPGRRGPHRATSSSPHRQANQRLNLFSQRPQTSTGIVSENLPLYPESYQNSEKPSSKLKTDRSHQSQHQASVNSRAPGGERSPPSRHGNQLTRSASLLERTSRPEIKGKSRRQLVEQAQLEASETDNRDDNLNTELKKQQEEIAAQKVCLDLKIKDFLRSLEQMKKPYDKKDILGRIINGSPLGYAVM